MGRGPRAFRRAAVVGAAAAGWGLLAAPAGAIPVTFTTIANETTAIPGGTGDFTQFQLPTVDRGRVAFFAQGAGGQSGIYTAPVGGAVARVADEASTDPGSGTAFTGFGDPDVDGDTVVFEANGSGVIGVYAGSGGSLSTVADNTDAIPGGTGNFSLFGGRLGADDGAVVFEGLGSGGQNGIYVASGGSLSVLADTATAIPGGTGDFGSFLSPHLDGGEVVFFGAGVGFPLADSGYYSDRTGSLDVVDDADVATQPVAAEADISDGRVAYRSNLDNGTASGVLLDLGPSVLTVATQTTPVPGGTGNFSFFSGDPALDSDLLAFRGNGPGGQDGLYLLNSVGLHEILAKGDTLDGKILSSAAVRPGGLSGRDIAFFAVFTDGTQGVYVATVPEPGSAALLGLGLAALARLRGRRPYRAR